MSNYNDLAGHKTICWSIKILAESDSFLFPYSTIDTYWTVHCVYHRTLVPSYACIMICRKIWLQGDRKEDMYREMYDRSMDGMHHNQLQESNGLTFINFGHDRKRMDHLTCFMGGLLVLGAWTDPKGFKSDRAQRDLKTARAMAYTCYQMYSTTPTGLAADIVQFNPNIIPYLREKAYKLRPETVESLFILNKITGDPIYREWGWEIFQSIEKYCRTDIAYGKVGDVYTIHAKAEDDMESFFLGETLKYLYLLFDPDSELDLEKYVFNTEAHPVRIK